MPIAARRNSKFMAVCTAPDTCKTPIGPKQPPVHYQSSEKLSSSLGTVPYVTFNDDPCYVLDGSYMPTCTGGEAGTSKGIRSGTVSGEVKPTEGSPHFWVDDKNVVREFDPCTLNNGNCPGVFITEPESTCEMNEDGTPDSDTNPPIENLTEESKEYLKKLNIPVDADEHGKETADINLLIKANGGLSSGVSIQD